MRKPFLPVVLVLLVLIGFGVKLSAQGPPLQIFQTAVNALATTLNGLVTTVAGLINTVNAIRQIVEPGNRLVTPPVEGNLGEHIGCKAVNVSASRRRMQIALYSPHTGQLLTLSDSEAEPGFQAVAVSGFGQIAAFCVITVVDGTKNDVRGVVDVLTVGTGGTRIGLAAQ